MNHLRCPGLAAVKVVVVLQKVKDRQKYASLEGQQIIEIVKKFLRKIPIKNGQVISGCDKFLGSLCSIHSIRICKAVSEEHESLGVVNHRTSVKILDIISNEEELAKSKFGYRFLSSNELKCLAESVQRRRDCMQSFILWGLPGCEKNLIISYLAMKCNAWLIEVNFHLYQSCYNCDPVKKLEELIDYAKNAALQRLCLFYIEECDKFCHYAGPQLLARLETLKDWNNASVGNLVLCATTDHLSDIDAKWRKALFKRQILLEAPKRAERFHILKSLLAGSKCADDLHLELVADATAGETEADLTTVVALAIQHSQENIDPTLSESFSEVTQADFSYALSCERFTGKQEEMFLQTRPVSWNQIGGHDSIKTQLLQATVWPLTHPTAFLRLGEFPPKGILLTGPPGCGKTTLVRAMTAASNIRFLSASAAQLYSPYVGESEKKMAALLQQAKACAPSVVFIDELDSVVGSRSMTGCKGEGGASGVHERVLSTLLNSLDGIGSRFVDIQRISKQMEIEVDGRQRLYSEDFEDNVLLVAASNRPDMIDKALLRPGRIDRVIRVPPPDLLSRLSILEVYTKDRPTGILDLLEIAKRTENFTGADLENLCKQTIMGSQKEQDERNSESGFKSACLSGVCSMGLTNVEALNEASPTNNFS